VLLPVAGHLRYRFRLSCSDHEEMVQTVDLTDCDFLTGAATHSPFKTSCVRSSIPSCALRSHQLPAEEIDRCAVGFEPRRVAQEAVDFVGQDAFLETHAVFRQAPREIDGLHEA